MTTPMGTVATYLGGRNEVTELKLLGRKVDFGLKPQYLTIYMLESSCLFLFGMDEIFYQIDIVRQNLFEAGLGKENVFDRRTNRSIGARATDSALGKGRVEGQGDDRPMLTCRRRDGHMSPASEHQHVRKSCHSSY